MSGVCGTILTSYQRCGFAQTTAWQKGEYEETLRNHAYGNKKKKQKVGLNPLFDIVAVKTHPIG
jgi:hypothetical protein